jgi:hypothetical protein
LALAVGILAGCGADKSVAPGQPSMGRDTIDVSPDSLLVVVGEVDSLSARLVDEDGRSHAGTVVWVVRDTTTVRRILTMALVAPIFPVSPGGTYVVASIEGGPSDSAKVIVTDEAPPPPPSVGRSFYASPSGSGRACTLDQPCALDVALTLAGSPGP